MFPNELEDIFSNTSYEGEKDFPENTFTMPCDIWCGYLYQESNMLTALEFLNDSSSIDQDNQIADDSSHHWLSHNWNSVNMDTYSCPNPTFSNSFLSPNPSQLVDLIPVLQNLPPYSIPSNEQVTPPFKKKRKNSRQARDIRTDQQYNSWDLISGSESSNCSAESSMESIIPVDQPKRKRGHGLSGKQKTELRQLRQALSKHRVNLLKTNEGLICSLKIRTEPTHFYRQYPDMLNCCGEEQPFEFCAAGGRGGEKTKNYQYNFFYNVGQGTNIKSEDLRLELCGMEKVYSIETESNFTIIKDTQIATCTFWIKKNGKKNHAYSDMKWVLKLMDGDTEIACSKEFTIYSTNGKEKIDHCPHCAHSMTIGGKSVQGLLDSFD